MMTLGAWILVVGDNTLRNLWVEGLEAEGYTAVGAADGLAAAALIHDLLPDLALLDLHEARSARGFGRDRRRDLGPRLPNMTKAGISDRRQ